MDSSTADAAQRASSLRDTRIKMIADNSRKEIEKNNVPIELGTIGLVEDTQESGLHIPTTFGHMQRQDVKDLKVGDEFIQHASSYEDYRQHAYKPLPNDKWTIGYGHTEGVKEGDSLSNGNMGKAEAKKLLLSDAESSADAVRRLVKVPLNQHQFHALLDFVFNKGSGEGDKTHTRGLKYSGLLKKVNAGKFNEVRKEFMKWTKQTDKKTGEKIEVPGLVARATAEADLFERTHNTPITKKGRYT